VKRPIAVLACTFFACVSCAGGAEVSGDRRIVGDATMSFLITPSRVEVGKAVRFALRVTNTGGRPEELRFASGQLYDFWVTDGAKEVWRWSDDRRFTQATQERSIPSQDSLTLEESWRSEGTGTLIAHGLLKAEGYDRELTGKLRVDG
jgi:hypothetical protein